MRVKYRCQPSLVKTLKEEQRRLVQAHLEMPKKMAQEPSMGTEQERCTCIHRFLAQCSGFRPPPLNSCSDRAGCPTSCRFVDTNASNTDRICTSGRTRTCSRRTSGSYRSYTTSTSGCNTHQVPHRHPHQNHLLYHPDSPSKITHLRRPPSSSSELLHLQDHHLDLRAHHLQHHHLIHPRALPTFRTTIRTPPSTIWIHLQTTIRTSERTSGTATPPKKPEF